MLEFNFQTGESLLIFSQNLRPEQDIQNLMSRILRNYSKGIAFEWPCMKAFYRMTFIDW